MAATDTCNCKKTLEEKLTKTFAAAKPAARGHKVILQGYSLALEADSLKLRPSMDYCEFAYVPLKNGGEKPHKNKGTMMFSFCPFCGIPINKVRNLVKEA